uniref:Uncharacterized protein n=1 Tax=Anguilla anguilla TaxID=7936 RepID=A0A0E9PWJ2_ANGAN
MTLTFKTTEFGKHFNGQLEPSPLQEMRILVTVIRVSTIYGFPCH